MPKNQVAYIGLSNLFGRIVTSLLKQSPNISKLVLYDDKNGGTVQSYTNGPVECNVTTIYGRERLPSALTKADIVVIGDELFQTPSPETIASIGIKAAEYARLIAEFSPNAIIVITAYPLNYILPIFARVLEAAGCFNPRRLLGATSCDTLRASTLLSSRLRLSPQKTILPVIGGASSKTRIPLFSQANSPIEIDQDTKLDVVDKLKLFDGTEYSEADVIERAYASVRFTHSVLAARTSVTPIPEIALTKNEEIPNVEYFSMPLLIGKDGVEKIMKLPKLSPFETNMLQTAVEFLNVDISASKNILDEKNTSEDVQDLSVRFKEIEDNEEQFKNIQNQDKSKDFIELDSVFTGVSDTVRNSVYEDTIKNEENVQINLPSMEEIHKVTTTFVMPHERQKLHAKNPAVGSPNMDEKPEDVDLVINNILPKHNGVPFNKVTLSQIKKCNITEVYPDNLTYRRKELDKLASPSKNFIFKPPPMEENVQTECSFLKNVPDKLNINKNEEKSSKSQTSEGKIEKPLILFNFPITEDQNDELGNTIFPLDVPKLTTIENPDVYIHSVTNENGYPIEYGLENMNANDIAVDAPPIESGLQNNMNDSHNIAVDTSLMESGLGNNINENHNIAIDSSLMESALENNIDGSHNIAVDTSLMESGLGNNENHNITVDTSLIESGLENNINENHNIAVDTSLMESDLERLQKDYNQFDINAPQVVENASKQMFRNQGIIDGAMTMNQYAEDRINALEVRDMAKRFAKLEEAIQQLLSISQNPALEAGKIEEENSEILLSGSENKMSNISQVDQTSQVLPEDRMVSDENVTQVFNHSIAEAKEEPSEIPEQVNSVNASQELHKIPEVKVHKIERIVINKNRQETMEVQSRNLNLAMNGVQPKLDKIEEENCKNLLSGSANKMTNISQVDQTSQVLPEDRMVSDENVTQAFNQVIAEAKQEPSEIPEQVNNGNASQELLKIEEVKVQKIERNAINKNRPETTEVQSNNLNLAMNGVQPELDKLEQKIEVKNTENLVSADNESQFEKITQNANLVLPEDQRIEISENLRVQESTVNTENQMEGQFVKTPEAINDKNGQTEIKATNQFYTNQQEIVGFAPIQQEPAATCTTGDMGNQSFVKNKEGSTEIHEQEVSKQVNLQELRKIPEIKVQKRKIEVINENRQEPVAEDNNLNIAMAEVQPKIEQLVDDTEVKNIENILNATENKTSNTPGIQIELNAQNVNLVASKQQIINNKNVVQETPVNTEKQIEGQLEVPNDENVKTEQKVANQLINPIQQETDERTENMANQSFVGVKEKPEVSEQEVIRVSSQEIPKIPEIEIRKTERVVINENINKKEATETKDNLNLAMTGVQPKIDQLLDTQEESVVPYANFSQFENTLDQIIIEKMPISLSGAVKQEEVQALLDVNKKIKLQKAKQKPKMFKGLNEKLQTEKKLTSIKSPNIISKLNENLKKSKVEKIPDGFSLFKKTFDQLLKSRSLNLLDNNYEESIKKLIASNFPKHKTDNKDTVDIKLETENELVDLKDDKQKGLTINIKKNEAVSNELVKNESEKIKDGKIKIILAPESKIKKKATKLNITKEINLSNVKEITALKKETNLPTSNLQPIEVSALDINISLSESKVKDIKIIQKENLNSDETCKEILAAKPSVKEDSSKIQDRIVRTSTFNTIKLETLKTKIARHKKRRRARFVALMKGLDGKDDENLDVKLEGNRLKSKIMFKPTKRIKMEESKPVGNKVQTPKTNVITKASKMLAEARSIKRSNTENEHNHKKILRSFRVKQSLVPKDQEGDEASSNVDNPVNQFLAKALEKKKARLILKANSRRNKKNLDTKDSIKPYGFSLPSEKNSGMPKSEKIIADQKLSKHKNVVNSSTSDTKTEEPDDLQKQDEKVKTENTIKGILDLRSNQISVSPSDNSSVVDIAQKSLNESLKNAILLNANEVTKDVFAKRKFKKLNTKHILKNQPAPLVNKKPVIKLETSIEIQTKSESLTESVPLIGNCEEKQIPKLSILKPPGHVNVKVPSELNMIPERRLNVKNFEAHLQKMKQTRDTERKHSVEIKSKSKERILLKAPESVGKTAPEINQLIKKTEPNNAPKIPEYKAIDRKPSKTQEILNIEIKPSSINAHELSQKNIRPVNQLKFTPEKKEANERKMECYKDFNELHMQHVKPEKIYPKRVKVKYVRENPPKNSIYQNLSLSSQEKLNAALMSSNLKSAHHPMLKEPEQQEPIKNIAMQHEEGQQPIIQEIRENRNHVSLTKHEKIDKPPINPNIVAMQHESPRPIIRETKDNINPRLNKPEKIIDKPPANPNIVAMQHESPRPIIREMKENVIPRLNQIEKIMDKPPGNPNIVPMQHESPRPMIREMKENINNPRLNKPEKIIEKPPSNPNIVAFTKPEISGNISRKEGWGRIFNVFKHIISRDLEEEQVERIRAIAQTTTKRSPETTKQPD